MFALLLTVAVCSEGHQRVQEVSHGKNISPSCAVFHPTRQELTTAAGPELRVWQEGKDAPLLVRLRPSAVHGLRYSPDGAMLGVQRENDLDVFDTTRYELIRSVPSAGPWAWGSNGVVATVYIHVHTKVEEGETLVSVLEFIRLWKDGRPECSIPLQHPEKEKVVFLALAADNTHLVAVTQSTSPVAATVRCWRLNDAKLLWSAGSEYDASYACSPKTQRLAAISQKGVMTVLDTANGNVLSTSKRFESIPGETFSLQLVRYDAEGNLITIHAMRKHGRGQKKPPATLIIHAKDGKEESVHPGLQGEVIGARVAAERIDVVSVGITPCLWQSLKR